MERDETKRLWSQILALLEGEGLLSKGGESVPEKMNRLVRVAYVGYFLFSYDLFECHHCNANLELYNMISQVTTG